MSSYQLDTAHPTATASKLSDNRGKVNPATPVPVWGKSVLKRQPARHGQHAGDPGVDAVSTIRDGLLMVDLGLLFVIIHLWLLNG